MKNTIETANTNLQNIYANNVLSVNNVNGKGKDSELCKHYSMYMQTRAKEILGIADYTVVYNFFKNNFLRAVQYDYVIVKARRAYMLARIFGMILLYNEEEQNNVESYRNALTKMRSDVYVYTQAFQEQQKQKLLILDDIIIHGRALNELVSYLTENAMCALQDIVVDSIVISATAECVQHNLSTILQKSIKKVDVVEWKRLSNEIVTLIQVSGQSYAAFTDSYLCEEGYEVPGSVYTVSNVENNARHIAGVLMDVEYDNIKTDYAFAWGCTRIYTNTATNAVIKKIAVPFVSLPLMTADEWKSYIRKYANNLYAPIINVTRSERKTVQNDYKLLTQTYKYVSNIASSLYAQTKCLKQLTTNNLFGSFGVTELSTEQIKSVKDMLTTMKLEQASQKRAAWLITCENRYADESMTIDKTNIAQEVQYMYTLKSVSLWYDVLRSCNNDAVRMQKFVSVNTLQKAMDTFLDELHSINEKNAMHNLPRQQGIPLYALYTVLKYADIQYNWGLITHMYNDFFAYVLSLWDVGIASYNVDVFTFNQQKYIGGCITDGEQAYHARMEHDSAMEVYALHLLKYNSASTSDFYKKINKLEEIVQNNADDNTINKERLKNVAKYYDENQSLQELYNMYPATKEQQKKVQSYVRNLY